MVALQERNCTRAEAELAVLAMEHGEIGAYLLDIWNLPGDIVESVQWHHRPEEAPTDLAIAGRYIFTPDIFDYLENLEPGVNDEIQITDAMRKMVKDRDMYGFRFDGKRYDIGNKLDFLKTNIEFALDREELRGPLTDHLKGLVG